MRLWPFENLAVVGALAATVHYAELPLTLATLGWALGAFALHTARSHAGRLAEDAGRSTDWLATWSGWAGIAAGLLAADASQRILLAAPLALWVVHTVYRAAYRSARQPAAGWAREDD